MSAHTARLIAAGVAPGDPDDPGDMSEEERAREIGALLAAAWLRQRLPGLRGRAVPSIASHPAARIEAERSPENDLATSREQSVHGAHGERS